MLQMKPESKSMTKRTLGWAQFKKIIVVIALKVPCCRRIRLGVLVFDEVVHVDFFHLLEKAH